MIILGLTGSIGMGKSATAAMFADAGIPVYDADAAVHSIYAEGGLAVEPLGERFPGVVVDGAVSRQRLRDIVMEDPDAMKDLEAIVHPLVGRTQVEFRTKALKSGAKLAVLDIPLLYETGGDQRCDYVAVVTAPPEIQRERVMARQEMSEADFEKIVAKQVPDAEKRARADFIISTAFGFDFTRTHVHAIIDLLSEMDTENR
ncbi:MAG: dephospho-CoA kinase [Henriciella sp.]|uniref:dephospho-CoA kinase n=1 Tax=Henriciella sp. TaxID=1968823 RepID=UPI000C0E75A3|nr:dephospho-CoA kinase [Henriciella sp.]MAN75131.1 dephospho-CoA kinase [Henriciella sp.]MBF33672.1 dephospho-CoA kinase [Hyphomonadaceae bacterium]MBK76418.1 dephospho-CoA kinase [Henriciella sp.]PHR77933.1 MAG: dephospho-CoA kinase [Henriciella sp.]